MAPAVGGLRGGYQAMSRLRALLVATSIPLAACSPQAGDAKPANVAAPMTATIGVNPFSVASTLPFQAPPFDRIKEGDYQPAIEEGMKQRMVEIDQIANNPDAPTFENTFVAMERSGAMLTRVMLAFGGVTSANTSEALQKVQEDEAPRLAAHQDAIVLNAKLFQRIEAVYNRREALKLDPESRRLVEVAYRNFVLGGARLSETDKAQLKDLNKEESTLGAQFVNKLLAAAKGGALIVDDSARLAGLAASDIAVAAQAAKERKLDGKWVLPLQNTTQQPELQNLSDRATRKALFEASWNRSERGEPTTPAN